MPILLDTPGRKLRLDIDSTVPVRAHEVLELPIPVCIPDGTVVVFDDGKLTGVVTSEGRVQFDQEGLLRPQIGMNVPNISMQGPLLTERDIEIIDLAQTMSIDYLDLSFIESSELIHAVRKLCDRPCAVKIETQLAMQNLEDICQHADMVIVARGDLSVECGLFNVVQNQKMILNAAKKHNKTSVVATGLLTLYPPQQSTVADTQNAVLDGANALLLSGDLPEGAVAVEAVRILKAIIKTI